MKKILLRVFLILIILAVIGLYIYDYTVNDVPPTKNLFRGCSVICLCIAAFIRTFQTRGRNSLDFFEKQYEEILGRAFIDQPFWRKKLLCAVRLYNEDNHGKALKYLTDLKQKTQTAEDDYAVDLFAALCFTDLEIYEQAIHIYQHLISKGNANSRIFSNLGHVQMQIGEHKEALRNYELALDYDRTNAYAYNNIAQAYFQMHEFDNAIPYAVKALEYVLADDTACYIGSPYAYHYLIEAMIHCGMEERARQMLIEYWGDMVNKGADTFWEVYDPNDDFKSPYGFFPVNSYCHAWSCAPAYFLRKFF